MRDRGNRWGRGWRRSAGRRLLLAVATAVVLPTAVAAAVQLQTANAPSPATGHAQVIAHGVAPMPAESIAWRVVADTAELPAAAETEQRALGFAVADRAALAVNDTGSGQQWRLAPGEAIFVPSGAQQQRVSLGSADAPYYRVALVAAEQANDAGGDRMVLAGSLFAAPVGRAFDIALVRDVLRQGESTSIASPNLPALVLATDGELEVRSSGQLPVRLTAGHAASLAGNLTIASIGTQPAVVVAAVIGPEMPAPPVPPTGSIALVARGCPASIDPDAFAGSTVAVDDTTACSPVALTPPPTLALADGSSLPPSQSDSATGTDRWSGLRFGTFPLSPVTIPNGFDRYVVVDGAGTVIGAGSTTAQSAATGLPVSAAQPDFTATIYFLRPGSATQMTLEGFACPATVTLDTLRQREADCVAVDTGFVPQLTAPGGQAVAPTDTGSGGRSTWSGLATGTYRFGFVSLPAGYDTYVVPEATFDPAAGDYTLTIDGSQPELALRAFFLQPAGAPASPTPVPGTPSANGTMTVALFDCPAGMTAQTFSPDACSPSKGLGVELVTADGERRGANEATVGAGALTWGDVPIGPVTVDVVSMPPDASGVIAPGASLVSVSPPAFAISLTDTQRAGGIAVYSLRPGTAASPTP